MSTSYPSSIDNLTNPTGTGGETQATVSHVAQHQNANDAIEAIEAVLGINPQGVSATVRQRLEAIEAAITALGTSSYTSLPDGSITTQKLGTNSVTTTKIADDQITAAKLQTDSITTSKIQNSAVTQAKLGNGIIVIDSVTSSTRPASPSAGKRIFESDTGRALMWDGTGWVIKSEPTQTWTPTYTNISIGNGTVVARYHRSDGYCDLTLRILFGTTTSITGAPTFTLPVAAFDGHEIQSAPILMYDSSVPTRFYGHAYLSSTTVFGIVADSAAGTYASSVAVSSTVPMTWATSDEIVITFRYRMTTRYS